jgi:methylaspartate mutase sigma subunit
MKQLKIVMGVIGADVHAVGNKILDYAFTQAGFKVINLGVMVSQKEYIEAAIESDADVIAVGSLYGHGEIDCRGLKSKCEEAGIGKIKLIVGGNLVVGKTDFQLVENVFKKMGFDKVYPPGASPENIIRDLKEEFGLE